MVRGRARLLMPLCRCLGTGSHKEVTFLITHVDARPLSQLVINRGKLGRWMFHVCRNPQTLEQELHYLLRQMTKAA